MPTRRQRRQAAATKSAVENASEITIDVLHANVALFEESAVLNPDGHLDLSVPATLQGPVMLILEPAEHKWRPIVLPAGTRWRLAPLEQPAPGLWRPGMPH